MAAYKVIQDVEAEDKLLGPLTLRQFIYGAVAAICLYLCYFTTTHNAGFLVVILLPIALIAGFFAFPWGRDQPTELWALAKLRFMLKPRRRIWNQSGIKELVTITAPKQAHVDLTNGLSQREVRSRLRALADTIDSRGWAIKNANLNLYGQNQLVMGAPDSDRLVAASSLPQPASNSDVQAADDIMDEKNNASAQRLDNMINQSAKVHRDKVMEDLQKEGEQKEKATNNYWFLNQPAAPTNIPSNMVTFNTQVVTPGMSNDPAADNSEDDAGLVAELDSHKQASPDTSYYGHLRTIQPLSAQAPLPPVAPPAASPAPPAPVASPSSGIPQVMVAAPQTAPLNPPATPVPPPVTPATQAAILKLASNDDLNVATIAREAERTAAQDEVVIKLH